ncbi:MAG: sn-glycerol-3-phosphate ABC transporter ATP-binding protein UgpC [Niameybacter sp.]|uniref:ABC transporter ATP-binding protein n=1 Tax=Niameybacter sp. TaxID=2033640 RepID=UPI002FC7FB62
MENVLFQNVSKQYAGNTQYALKDFNLHIKAGELIVIVGPSGSGKSTLLELICGFEALTEGDILIDGKSIKDKLPKERDVAMVFQNYALLPHLNVYENIAFGMRIRKVSKARIKEKVEWAANMLELTPYLKVKPKKLSGGQRQRVALARAMVREPKLFLMDEPLSNLDAKLRDNMVQEIQALHEALHGTMLYVTHDQVEAMTIADRMVILNEGQVQQIGTPREVYGQPRNLFVAKFIGRPTLNLFVCQATRGGILLEEEIEIPVEDTYLEEGKSYVLGIRSEHIQCVEENAHLEAVIQKIEYLGSESLLQLKYKSCKFTVKDYNTSTFKVGDLIKVRFNVAQAHYFDSETQQTITEAIK